MKNHYFVLAIIAFFALPSNAQWITLYEGGNNTTHNIKDEWNYYFMFESFDTLATNDLSTSDNNYQMLYNIPSFESGAAGIYKNIPGMENYLSLRVKIIMDLPDNDGTESYYSQDVNQNGFLGTMDTWNPFGANTINEYVYFSNPNGDNGIHFRTDLLRGDSVFISYDYILIEADTTQMLSIDVNTAAVFDVYSNGSQININTKNNQDVYEYAVISTNGNEIIKGKATGNTLISDEFDSGVYFVLIKSNTSTIRHKVYLH